MTEVVVARLLPPPVSKNDLSVSVIIPCKDEKGNVEAAVRRMPQLGRETEIIFCDDQSSDGTADEIMPIHASYPTRTFASRKGQVFANPKMFGPVSMQPHAIF